MNDQELCKAEFEKIQRRSKKSLVPGILFSLFLGFCAFLQGPVVMLIVCGIPLCVFTGEHLILKHIKITDYREALRQYYRYDLIVVGTNLLLFAAFAFFARKQLHSWAFVLILLAMFIDKLVFYRKNFR